MYRLCAVLPLLLVLASASGAAEPVIDGSRKDEPVVDLAQFAPRIVVELRYTTPRNLARRAIYPTGARCLLRKSVAERLLVAQRWLDNHAPAGTRLKIWDGYRPAAAHRQLWKAFPDREYVADPSAGGSMHTWGVAVDATLVDGRGRELKMPTDFDVLTPAARTYYQGNDPEVRRNLRWLQNAMSKGGFLVVLDEWWHFVARDYRAFGPLDLPLVAKQQSR